MPYVDAVASPPYRPEPTEAAPGHPMPPEAPDASQEEAPMDTNNIHYLPSSTLGSALIKTSRHSASPEPRGLSRVQAAEYIGVGTSLFDAMVKDGRMPRPFKVGARVIWDRHQVDASFDALSDQDADDRNPWDALAA